MDINQENTAAEFEQMLDETFKTVKGGDRVKGIVRVDEILTLINITMNDITISTFNGPAEETLTIIGQSINEKAVIDFM